MIRGVVTADREAVIRLMVQGPLGTVDVDAVIDTGFNDLLTLPASLVSALGLAFRGTTHATLADGTVTGFALYQGTVQWDGAPRSIQALEADGGPLVGMALLAGCDLFIEAVPGGQVTITQRP